MSNSRKKNTIKYPGDVTEEVDASYITMTIDGKDYGRNRKNSVSGT